MGTGQRPCDDEGRDWSDAFTSQGTPRIASGHQKLEKRHKTDSLSDPLGGILLLISWSPTSSLQNLRINFCGFKPPNLWCCAVFAELDNLLIVLMRAQDIDPSQNKSCSNYIHIQWLFHGVLHFFLWFCELPSLPFPQSSSPYTCQSQGPQPYYYSECDFQHKWRLEVGMRWLGRMASWNTTVFVMI